MFQKLNSMFMGESSDILSHEPELCEKEDDDEWILVDFVVDTCTQTPEEASTLEEIVVVDHPVLSFKSGALKQCGNTSDSYLVHFEACPMEESWFITPPPCFTAVDLTTKEVETSPMENLLIEHPSMSVYAVHSLSNKQADACDSEFDTASSLRLDTELTNVGRQIRCYVAAIAARTHCLDQAKALHYTKLSKQQVEKKPLLNRKSLRRQNLIRGCQSRQLKHSGILVHQPCHRRYNY